MSKLYAQKMNVKCVDLGKENALPTLFTVSAENEPPKSVLPEGDGLYLGYRFIRSTFPYGMQEHYSRTFNGEYLDGLILENEYLRASFAPALGGKLWSLYDKVNKKELLFSNPVARPSWLATRNAWCSGGVEWNCGIYGHTPFTCSPLFAATLTGADGEPILRMYEFERVRGVVYQMDFTLPEGSKVLFCRMRVVNPSRRDTAMYWWSNIAVPHTEGARVVVPAERAYTTSEKDGVISVPIPLRDGLDVTYPDNNPISVDYFFHTDDARRRYTCQLSPEGYGLFQSSTSLLKGRKIFVWGQGPGGRKWQEYLSGEGNKGQYCEIQCGLAYSQYECLPMPPTTAWEWMEIYGAMQADPKKIFGDWDGAREEVEARIGDVISVEALEQKLKATLPDALKPAETMLWQGSGWAALENLRREKAGLGAMCPHLDFGKIDDRQKAWFDLLESGTMGAHEADEAPASWMRQTEWTKLMEKACEGNDRENWYTLMQLGCTYLAEPDLLRAEIYLTRSLEAKKTAWNLYAMAELERIKGNAEKSTQIMIEAALMLPDQPDLAKAASRALHQAERFAEQIAFTDKLSAELREIPRIRLYRAFACVALGDAAQAEALLYRDGQWIEVPDIQECELSLSEVWYRLQELKLGTSVDRNKVSPPYALDFRMFATE